MQGYTMADEYDLGSLYEIMEAVAAADAAKPGRISRRSLRAVRAPAHLHRARKGRPSVTGLPSTRPHVPR